MPDPWTKTNLDEVEDAALANGFGERWEAHVAREDLDAERTGLSYFRLHPVRGRAGRRRLGEVAQPARGRVSPPRALRRRGAPA